MNDRRLAVALFILAFGPYVYFYGGWGANQEVNYALTRAIVEGQTFAVDDYTVREGDIAAGEGGHIFINKPPGLSMLGVIPYSLQYSMQQRRIVQFRDYWRTNKELVTIATSGLTGALISPILYLYARRRANVPRRNAVLATVFVAFGTIVFPYSTMMFAHAPSACFLLLAFVLLPTRPLLAGAAAGVAGAAFLLSAVGALVLVALAWSWSARKAMLFVAGGVPFAIALAIYQWICFGSPFTTPLERSDGYTSHDLTLGVFGSPHLGPLWGITFSEYRGLFFCSPVLLFAFLGVARMMRQRHLRPELLAIGAIVVLFFLVNASFNGWHGGAAFGPRYLVPIVPLLAIPMMFISDRVRLVWLLIGALSIAINLAATAVDPMAPEEVPRPVTAYIVPTLLRGEINRSPDMGNLGEALFGKGQRASIWPALLWIVAGTALLLHAVEPKTAAEST